MLDTIKNFFLRILNTIPDILVAILLLVIAFVAANIVKSLVVKLMGLIKAEKLNKVGIKPAAAESAKKFVAKLAYFVTFLLFLPAVLDKLGMRSVSTPISSLAQNFLGFIPKLVAAGIILAVGVFIANILKDLLLPLLKATKIDALQEKTGIKAGEKTTFSNVITNIIYGFVLLVVIACALDQLEIAAISGPINQIVNSIFGLIPSILGAIVIIAVGVFIAVLVANLLESLLAGVGVDGLIEKITGTPAKKIVLSKVIAAAVKYILCIIFIVQGLNVLNLPVLTNIGAAIISFIPTALVVIAILGLGIFAGNTVESLIAKKFATAKATAFIAKIAIYVVSVFLCLSQLGIANAIVEGTFILVVAAIAVAFAISFGIGGRTFAANTLAKLEKKMDDNSDNAQ